MVGSEGVTEIRICAVGDSHSWHAWLNIPWAEAVTFGPMTMHTLGQTKPIMVTKVPVLNVPVCFCYGEIDCRFRVKDHQPWEETVDELVRDFLIVIDENAKINPNIWLFNVLPPPRRDHLDCPSGNSSFPFRGSDKERLAYVTRMNQRLKESKYVFVDVYDKYCDEEGFLNMKMSDGHVHIADEKPLMEWVDNKLKELAHG